MPNLNGLESTRLIRETGYSAPIVALSAYSEDQNIKECLESGMNDFISKPIRRPRLKQVLKTFCSPIPEEEAEDAAGKEPAAGKANGSAARPSADVMGGNSASITPSTTSTKVETTKPLPSQRTEDVSGGGPSSSGGQRPGSPVSPLS